MVGVPMVNVNGQKGLTGQCVSHTVMTSYHTRCHFGWEETSMTHLQGINRHDMLRSFASQLSFIHQEEDCRSTWHWKPVHTVLLTSTHTRTHTQLYKLNSPVCLLL